MNTPRPFQRLDDRLAGKPPDDVLLPGVPDHLNQPLREWLFKTLNNKFGSSADELAKAVVLSLGWFSSQRLSYRSMLSDAAPQEDLLVVVDAVLDLALPEPEPEGDRG